MTIPNLYHLSLQHNGKISDDGVEKLIHLESLNLSHSCRPYGTKVVKGMCFSKLSKLRKLDLSNNIIVSNSYIKGLTNLTYLNLTSNSKVVITTIQNLTNLKELCVNTKITGRYFSKLKNIEIFSILRCNNKITNEDMIHFKKLKVLKFNVRLNHKLNITFDVLKHFPELNKVVIIGIDSSNNNKFIKNLIIKAIHNVSEEINVEFDDNKY